MKKLLAVCITTFFSYVVHAATYEIPYMPRGSDFEHQGFMRITNLSELTAAVDVVGIDDIGLTSITAQFTLSPGATKGFRIRELEQGDVSKGLTGFIGTGIGDWRILYISDAALRVVGFYRNPATGFLNSLHDTAHSGFAGLLHILPTVNPGSNPNQVGKIRITNPSSNLTTAQISGIDDQGVRFPDTGSAVVVNLLPRGSVTLTMAEIEQGSNNPAVTGALGNGSGKWRLTVISDSPVGVLSLIFAPNGYLSNITTSGQYNVEEGGRFPISCETIDGAVIMSGSVRPIFLGFFGSVSGEDSIYNPAGDYGSSTSSSSIFNPLSQWGSPTSDLSAFNDSSTAAPLIVKHGKILSILTTNPTTAPFGLDPNLITNACTPFNSLTAKSIYNPLDFGVEASVANTNSDNEREDLNNILRDAKSPNVSELVPDQEQPATLIPKSNQPM